MRDVPPVLIGKENGWRAPIEAQATVVSVQSPQVGLSPAACWDVLRRPIRLMTAIVLAAIGLSVAALAMQPGVYAASATILIGPQSGVVEPSSAIRMNDLGPVIESHSYYETQVDILKSRSLAAHVIGRLGLARNRGFIGSPVNSKA